MRHARSVLPSALIAQATFAMAQQPICNPCVDGPEMFEHRRSGVPNYPPSYAREVAEREFVTFARGPALSEADLLAYASKPYEKSALQGRRIALGNLNGVRILVELWCADICPDYAVRVIYFAVPPGPSCTSVGGAEISLKARVGGAVTQQAFCFPQILVNHWDAYVR